MAMATLGNTISFVSLGISGVILEDFTQNDGVVPGTDSLHPSLPETLSVPRMIGSEYSNHRLDP